MNEKGFVVKTSGYSIHICTMNCSDAYPGIPSVTHTSCAVLLYQLTETSTVGSSQCRHHLQCTRAYSTVKYMYYSHQAHLVQVALTVEYQGHLHHLSDTRHCEEMTKCTLLPPGSPHVCTNKLGERANRFEGSRRAESFNTFFGKVKWGNSVKTYFVVA